MRLTVALLFIAAVYLACVVRISLFFVRLFLDTSQVAVAVCYLNALFGLQRVYFI